MNSAAKKLDLEKPSDVDTYIAKAPREARTKLSQLRKIVKTVAPEAEEVISYKMPYYRYHGVLVGFAAFKDHIGFFGALTPKERDEFDNFEVGKGTIRFPLNEPLPVESITKLIMARKKRNESKRRANNLPPDDM